MNVQSPPRMSIDAFFRWIEGEDGRYELVDGIRHLQPWVKRSHSLIVGNIDFALKSGLDLGAFAVHQGDFAIATGPQSLRYADLLVEPAGGSLEARTTADAVLIVEVLSDSTMHVDFGDKLREYQALPALDTYLIVAQSIQRCWQWTRNDEGEWPAEPLQLEPSNSSVSIERLGVRLAFADIYRTVS